MLKTVLEGKCSVKKKKKKESQEDAHSITAYKQHGTFVCQLQQIVNEKLATVKN